NCYGRTCIWSFVPTVLWGLYYPLYYEAIKRTVMVEPASGASSPQYCGDYTIHCTTRPSKELLWSNLHLELRPHSTVGIILSIVLRGHQKNCYGRTCIWSFVPTVLWGLYYPLYYEAIKRTVMVEPASGASSTQYCGDFTINC